jgi:hypothetical protein
LHAKDYDNICLYFWKGNIKETANYIWHFLKRTVKYSIEPDTRQSVKSPSAILSTGYYNNGYNDCKHYSQFTAGVLDALNRKGKKINWCFRFANYRMFTKQPQHVFIVIDPGTKNEIWIDPVLKNFNEKKHYINKIDKKINMPLYKISGVENYSPFDVTDAFGQIEIGQIKRKTTRAQRVASRKAKGGSFVKRTVKNIKTASKTAVKTVARGVKKVYASVPRQSFLALVKINAFNMALNLNESLKNPAKRQKLLSKWFKLGGNTKTLLLNIEQGIKQYKKKNPNYIGVDVTALIASATPIVLALVEFIGKNAKEKAEQNAQNATAEEKQQIEQVRQASNAPGATPNFTSPASSRSAEANAPGSASANNAPEIESEETTSATGTGLPKNILLYAGLGLGAYFLLTRKK